MPARVDHQGSALEVAKDGIWDSGLLVSEKAIPPVCGFMDYASSNSSRRKKSKGSQEKISPDGSQGE